MKIHIGLALAIGLIGCGKAVSADETATPNFQDRLMVIDSRTHRVIFDDKHDDLVCVTAQPIVAYDFNGNPIRRRGMHCR